jgi:PAS domain S-box-containing protein
MDPLEPSAAALLAAIVDSSDDAIVSKTLDGVIVSWNRAAEKIFGYTAAEAIGQHITLIIPDDRRSEEEEVLATIRRGEKVDHFETIRRAKDGQQLNISLTVSPVRDADGRIVGVSKIARDITERMRLERERDEQWVLLKTEALAREKAQAELAEAVTARDDFIAVAAHELRNPLNVLVLTLQLLHRVSRDVAGSAQVRELIEKSQIQLSRLSTLMDRLLDVTRIQGGSFELHRQKFDLTCLIREVIARIVEPAGVLIRLDLETSIEGTWDRFRIDQAITNLISNAIKYGMQRPISIRARVSDGHTAIVSVRDEGVGISSEDLKRIFKRFERAAPTLGNHQGLGLGLWITKQIVEAHGGAIVADSAPGNGAVFTVMLPLQ